MDVFEEDLGLPLATSTQRSSLPESTEPAAANGANRQHVSSDVHSHPQEPPAKLRRGLVTSQNMEGSTVTTERCQASARPSTSAQNVAGPSGLARSRFSSTDEATNSKAQNGTTSVTGTQPSVDTVALPGTSTGNVNQRNLRKRPVRAPQFYAASVAGTQPPVGANRRSLRTRPVRAPQFYGVAVADTQPPVDDNQRNLEEQPVEAQQLHTASVAETQPPVDVNQGSLRKSPEKAHTPKPAQFVRNPRGRMPRLNGG